MSNNSLFEKQKKIYLRGNRQVLKYSLSVLKESLFLFDSLPFLDVVHLCVMSTIWKKGKNTKTTH